MRKKQFLVMMLWTALFTFCACSGGEADVFVQETTEAAVYLPPVYDRHPRDGVERPTLPFEMWSEAADDEPDIDWSQYTISKLTGLPIPIEDAARRPVAVVVNNHYSALPQSGLSQADLIYEVLAEGDITRLVAIFQSFDADRIGPVRSARDYFVDFALDYDGIFVHHGGSPSGYERLRALKINRLDGLTLEGTYFWRDRTYPDWYQRAGQRRAMEHSSYTNAETIKKAIVEMGFRETLHVDRSYGFVFDELAETSTDASASAGSSGAVEPSDLSGSSGTVESTGSSEPSRSSGTSELSEASGSAAASDSSFESGSPDTDPAVAFIQLPFSARYTRTFTYDTETNTYAVLNGDGPHMDANTGNALTVSNILIQSVRSHVIAGDDAGRREVGTVGRGTGWLVRNGILENIKWEKDDHVTPTVWTFENGTDMALSPGKTWICVYQDGGEALFE